MLPGVVAAFSNPNVDVRKASVACLVNIYLGLGEQAMPFFMRDLTPSQMKLMTLYIGRQSGLLAQGKMSQDIGEARPRHRQPA